MFELLEITLPAWTKMADSEEVVVVSCNISRRKSPSGPSASKMSCTDEETELLRSLCSGEMFY